MDPRSESDIVVGVTGLKTIESPQPGFAIARSLQERGYEVVGIDDSPLTAAAGVGWFDSVYTSTYLRTEDWPSFLKFLKSVKAKTGLATIIPGYDREVFLFAENHKALAAAGIRALIASPDSLRRASKLFLAELRHGVIPIPRTAVVRSRSALFRDADRLGYPVVCKGLVKDAYVANSRAEALAYFEHLRQIWGGGSGPVLLQEFVFGDAYCVAGVADAKSNVVSAVTIKKLGTDSKGSTWCGYTVVSQFLTTLCHRVVKHLGWVGGFELELLRQEESGKYFLFEFNPRLPSWVYLATAAGQNLPDLLVRLALGLPVKRSAGYTGNLAFLRAPLETICSMKSLERLMERTRLNGR